MAKKDGTISATNIDKFLKAHVDTMVVHVQSGDAELELEIKRVVDMDTFATMVHRAVNSVFMLDEDTNEMIYHAEYERFACCEAMFAYVTNLGKSLTVSRVMGLMGTKIQDTLKDCWEQYDMFIDAVAKAIEYRKQVMLCANEYRIQLLAERLDAAIGAFEHYNEAFENITPDEMKATFKRLAEMDDTAIVEVLTAKAAE